RYRDGKHAIELATRAVELKPDDWSYRDTLAAAHAEAGDFTEARNVQLKAIDLFEADPNTDSRDLVELRERLKLYLAKRPYREAPASAAGVPLAPPPRPK